MGSAANPATNTATKAANKPANGYASSSDIPANAIYANGEAIPDPSGTGYLMYEV